MPLCFSRLGFETYFPTCDFTNPNFFFTLNYQMQILFYPKTLSPPLLTLTVKSHIRGQLFKAEHGFAILLVIHWLYFSEPWEKQSKAGSTCKTLFPEQANGGGWRLDEQATQRKSSTSNNQSTVLMAIQWKDGKRGPWNVRNFLMGILGLAENFPPCLYV